METRKVRLMALTEEELEKNNIPFKPGTFYAWKSRGIYPQIFVKIGGKLFVNLDEWEKIIQEAILSSQKQSEKIKKYRKLSL